MMRTKYIAGLGSLAIVGLSPAVAGAAEGLEYSYFELDAIGRDIDAFDDEEGVIEDLDDGGGWSLGGSYQFLPRFFVFGDYSNTESDVAYTSDNVFPLPAETEIKRFDLGVGMNQEINDRVDFIGRVAYADIDYNDFDLGSGGDIIDGGLDDARDQLQSDDSDGYFVDAGVRAQLTPNLEGTVGVRYTDVQNIDTTTAIGSLMFELSESWGIDLSVDAGDEIATYRLGVRFTPES